MSKKYLGGYLVGSTSLTIPASGDPQFNYVTTLLHGDGTNGAQNNTFLDSSTNNYTVTRNGNPTQGTFSPYGSLWSNYFNGSSDYLELASNSAFNMNTYCCLEAWVCYTTIGTSTLIVGRDSSYWLGYNFTALGGTTNKFVFTINNGSSWQAVSSTTTPVAGVWYQVVGIKDNTTLRIYINGTQENTASFSGTAVTSSNVMGIGANQNTQNMAGYISNSRLVLGASSTVLPYTGNFTPSTTPLTAVSGTALLTCQSNRFIDNSSNAFAITVGGSPTVQRYSPFNASTAYSTSVIGGSMYTSGATGNYLSSTLNSSGLSLTGNMTIQGWIYTTAFANEYVFAVGTGSYRIALQLYNNRAYVAYGDIYTYKSTTQTQYSYLSNSWHHFAIVRNSNDVRLYIDGVDQGSYGTITTNPTDYDLYVADGAASAVPFYGYLSNIVFTQSAVYTAAFTPPTAPVSTGTVLLNFTNAGIYDNAEMSVFETIGNAQISTSVYKYGTGSLAFDGTGDGLSLNYNPYVDMGSGDFTYEWWMNPSSQPSQAGIWVQSPDPSTFGPIWFVYESGIMRLYATTANGSWNIASQVQVSGTIATGTWTHFALTRSGGVWRSFVNGTQYWTITNSGSLYVLNTPMYIGIFGGGSRGYNGYLDDFRITKGYARYTSNFTAPTAAFPNSYTPAVTTSIVPTSTSAPGIWTLEQAAYYKAQGLWPTPPLPTPTVDYIVVAGGGGGGRYTSGGGCGGGGAGGFRTASSFAVSSGSALTVTVGAGGAAATNGAGSTGSNSVFSTITSNGGGGGGSRDTANPGNGGSGGGAAANSSGFTKSGGTGNTPSTSPSQGNNGGDDPGPDTAPNLAAGGGGASAVGANRDTGTGGAGTASSYSGSSVTYAGGGAGGSYSGTSAVSGGAGGGGNGGYDTTSATSGTANRGGGGGGSGNGGSSAAGSGGSGVVVIRYANTYPDASATTGSPTYANTGGYKIYTFTASGTITF